MIKTEFGKNIWGNDLIMKVWNNSLEAPYRLGLPEDIANIIAFIASDEAKYIIGETINLSGTSISRLWWNYITIILLLFMHFKLYHLLM